MWRRVALVRRGMEANSRRTVPMDCWGEDRRRSWVPAGMGDTDRLSAAGRLQLYAVRWHLRCGQLDMIRRQFGASTQVPDGMAKGVSRPCDIGRNFHDDGFHQR